jgi:drug/metabolite transporter (DMT)-like permease
MGEFTTRIISAWVRLPANAQGALWVTVGTVIFAANDTLIKTLGGTIHPIEMVFFRYCVGALILVPVFWRARSDLMTTRRLPLHIARGIIAGIGQAGSFYAVVHLLLVDATAVQFSRPLFMTFLAIFILGETVGWRRWVATLVGFGGVIVMLRPGYTGLDIAWGVALATALIFAVAMILIRKLSQTESATRILFFYHLTGLSFFLLPAVWVWRTPVGIEWLLLFLIGLLTTIAMVCFVRGLTVGEASIVGPMEYTRLIYAAILGYLLFAEVPVIWTWVGAAIIVASAIYIARREAFATRP